MYMPIYGDAHYSVHAQLPTLFGFKHMPCVPRQMLVYSVTTLSHVMLQHRYEYCVCSDICEGYVALREYISRRVCVQSK